MGFPISNFIQMIVARAGISHINKTQSALSTDQLIRLLCALIVPQWKYLQMVRH